MQIEYRVCSEEDISQLMKVALQSYVEHYTYLWLDDGEHYMKNSFSAEQLSSEIRDSNSIFFLVIVDKLPVGFIKLNVDKAIDSYHSKKALELERIYFLKSAAGKGLGKEALCMIAKFAKDRDKKAIWLKAMKGGAAHGFYQKQGFALIGETILAYPLMKEEHRGMVVMLKEI
ncbi:GNAT family N-acetyltransferase [Emticicia fontis]